jgi:hypothetical protein
MAQHLPGGLVNAVVRVGHTVHRPPSPNAGFVQELLAHLERHGWDGAPRYLGTDAEGREVLSFLEGHMAWAPTQPASVRSDESLAAVARLVRRFHDLTAGTPLAGTAEVVCHNDLSPSNTVYRDRPDGDRPPPAAGLRQLRPGRPQRPGRHHPVVAGPLLARHRGRRRRR